MHKIMNDAKGHAKFRPGWQQSARLSEGARVRHRARLDTFGERSDDASHVMNTSRIIQSSALVLAVVAASISACSSDPASNRSPASGGTAGKSTGGGSSGGASATGGKASTGGSSSGGAATGGSKATGGSSSGGAAAGGTSSGGATAGSSGGGSATGGAGNGVAGFPGTCTLESADASAKGKTCDDFCTAWNGTRNSCHDIEALKTLFPDEQTNAECIAACQAKHSETQFCCRMQHVLLSLGPNGTGEPAIDPTLAVHCDHAAGLSVCP